MNNIQGDTTKIVDKYNVGSNITDENISEVTHKVVVTDINKIMKQRENSMKLFEEQFSIRAFNEKLEITL